MMKKSRLLGAVYSCVFTLFCTSTGAALVDRGGGLIYDEDQDITWLADANYAMTSGYDADGLMNLTQATAWARDLVYGGFSDWRLPSTLQPDPTCDGQSDSNGDGVLDYSTNYYCSGSEMGNLFYIDLSGTAHEPITESNDPDLALFSNIQSEYWSGSPVSYNPSYGWVFWFGSGGGGLQGVTSDYGYLNAWAVHDGDIGAVPIPPAFWLFGSGLIGLVGVARKAAKN